ncbi:cupin domain-containing protein [Sinosporangium siamense]|uniref:(S)-ureidoglycine aminohydrolase cupin domain-containing protein n=1 Tax=Sinosporangium siamense TaxID=1367973 RepID=A0A919RFT0_9ACTN|nr:cupin domain-containing protein [Sinosporangium siamense]GII92917.1 hypothetical protein Ssi02_31480 [Sinosporangium siamense]
MTVYFQAKDAFEADLPTRPLEPPMATPLGGSPIDTRSRVIFNSEDDAIKVGLWECQPGESRWEFDRHGEFVHILAGKMTVRRDGEPPVVLASGDSAVFPPGWTGVWEVHEQLRKIFLVFGPR